NFITRDDFEGFELRASHQFIQDSDGDSEFGAIWGHNFGKLQVMAAAEYSTRGELNIKDRDWAIRDFADNPQGGISSIGNPGSFVDLTPDAANGGGLFNADPNCLALGGQGPIPGNGTRCGFQFTFFDNLIEKTESVKLFTSASYELGQQNLRFEAAYAEVDIPEWKTSPAYPPQTLLGPDRAILPNHPGRIAFMAANPDFAARFDPNEVLLFWGRYTGVAGVRGGQPEDAQRLTNQYRASIGMDGPLFDGAVNYDFNLAWSVRNRKTEGQDMSVERSAFALRGLGGPGCDPATGTAGVGPCEYYNPFSNAIQTSAVTGLDNPGFDPSVANSPELLDWLIEEFYSKTKNELLVADLVFSGDTKWALDGGQIGYAVGAQARQEVFDFSVPDLVNLNLFPCPFNNPASITQGFVGSLDCTGSETGQFAFLSGSFPSRFERTIYAFFGELALPVSDRLDIQLAARFEDYGEQNGGATFDPKIAAKFQATDNLALRGSVSTTFRGAPQSSLGGRFTSLAFVAPTTAFKAIDTIGNPDLEPETALSTNIGVLFDAGGFTGSLDYWRFDFEKPFQLENFNQVVSAYTANGCEDGGAGVGSPTCDSLRAVIFPIGTPAAGIQRIERQLINGSDITTDGIDFFGEYAWEYNNVDLSVGAQGTYTLSYESEDFLNRDGILLAEGDDFVGFINEGTPFQTLVELRGNIFARAQTGPHTLTYNLRYTDEYEDAAPPLPAFETIDSHITHDITYNLSLFEGKTRLSATVFNLTDEDPPAAATDLNYDAFTHNPFGRMVKIGITQQF
ncbi:MAG: TonB-dependent receptor, partial [Pseudomonadota bacterium]